MRFIVIGSEDSLGQLRAACPEGIAWHLSQNIDNEHFDAIFYMDTVYPGVAIPVTDKPVFINSVVHTLQELGASPNMLRFNGWNTFLQNPSWEICGEISAEASAVMSALQKTPIPVKDIPGFIAARVVAMIINEAYFALEEGVSSRSAIDTAMKLGTNYPYGPFEWATQIGIKHICQLLDKLAESDSSYQPAPLLVKETSVS